MNEHNEEDRPGVAGCIMKPDDAIAHINDVTSDGPIAVVGVAGPGDSLANEETLTMKRTDRVLQDALLLILMTLPQTVLLQLLELQVLEIHLQTKRHSNSLKNWQQNSLI